MEMIITVALIGVLATVAIHLAGSVPETVQATKLESDVVMLNQLVGLYVSDGGNLSGATTPQSVIDKLKKVRTTTDITQHAGNASGRLVDIRLRARNASGPLPSGSKGRATWNNAKKRFEIANSAAPGVEEFYLDDALADTNYGSETTGGRSQEIQ
jgi:type II secretory pathway pseudopilin PulG